MYLRAIDDSMETINEKPQQSVKKGLYELELL